MQRCYSIYKTADDPEERIAAIDLLRVVADGHALPWIPEFLADAEPGIQVWGAGVLDQLLISDLIDVESCNDLLSQLEIHPNEQVRSTHAFIQEYLDARLNRG